MISGGFGCRGTLRVKLHIVTVRKDGRRELCRQIAERKFFLMITMIW